MNPSYAAQATTPLVGRDLLLASVGAVVGVGIGVAATRWILQRRSAAAYQPSTPAVSDEELRQRELLERLAEALGNPDLSPANQPFGQIVMEIQVTMGLDTTDGTWTPETEQAVLDMIQEANPRRSRPTPNPAHELEPDENWQAVYEREFPRGLQDCCDDERVVAFDQAVVAVLEFIFPESGSFALAPHTGQWKRGARDRACADLTEALGPTEVQARAVLTRGVGVQAMSDGADLGQAVRVMAQCAWPTAVWEGASRLPWQDAFTDAAAASLQP